ncbi:MULTISPECIES: DUF1499 domain-containing protein [unclassified Exiguobacterium]|uniref:DUF1499 domain-containing protein n=1 Tax=unclassified Exiguobacterium TaxID=2644629 RepID=UPI000B591C03|nr:MULTISPECIES: DUF1499 domain-containing protein [unclassified Exiguobacterium]ASI36665.1 hypothetical protein A0126_14090 [Exiguobacterium sp. N4-1P]
MALGVSNGALSLLNGKPNAVSTQTDQQALKMDPLPFKGTMKDSKFQVMRILQSLDRVKIVKETPDYIHAVFSSKFFHFKDDVEFYFDQSTHLVHFRSASRVGYSDWGVNRKRMEDIVNRYQKEESQ